MIVPNYNHVSFLEERLQSIAAQTVQDIELILLDDASTDGSDAILRRWSGHPKVSRLEINPTNSGSPFSQWRKGVDFATGEWVWIAESDDRCAPDLLEKLLHLDARSGGSLGLVYAQSEIIAPDGNTLGSMAARTAVFRPDPFTEDFTMDGQQFIRHHLKVMNVIPNASAVLARRSLLQAPALWQGTGELRMVGDWLIWIRLLRQSHVGFIARALNGFRDQPNSSRQHMDAARKHLRLLEEAVVRGQLGQFPDVDQTVELRKLEEAWFSHFRWVNIGSKLLRQMPSLRKPALFMPLRFAWYQLRRSLGAIR